MEMDEFAKLRFHLNNNGILDVFAALIASDEKVYLETAENVSSETID